MYSKFIYLYIQEHIHHLETASAFLCLFDLQQRGVIICLDINFGTHAPNYILLVVFKGTIYVY